MLGLSNRGLFRSIGSRYGRELVSPKHTNSLQQNKQPPSWAEAFARGFRNRMAKSVGPSLLNVVILCRAQSVDGRSVEEKVLKERNLLLLEASSGGLLA